MAEEKTWTIWRPILQSSTLPGGLWVGVWNIGEPPKDPGSLLKGAEFEVVTLVQRERLAEVEAEKDRAELVAQGACELADKAEAKTAAFEEALKSDAAKDALFDAHFRYQHVDPREQSEDGWITALIDALLEAAHLHVKEQSR